MKKKLVYWKQKEETLCQKLRESLINNNPSETSRMMRKLEGKLRVMIESIMVKYYAGSYNYNDSELYINDTLSHLITVFHQYNPERKKTYYSYLSGIIKRELYNQIVDGYVYGHQTYTRNDYHLDFEKNQDIIENIDKIFPVEDSNEDENKIKNRERLYDYFETLIQFFKKKLANATMKKDVTNYTGLLTSVQAMYKTAKKFEGNDRVEKSEMVDYAIDNHGASIYYLNKAFSTKNFVRRNIKYESTKDYDYLNDWVDFDFTPNQSHGIKSYKRKKILGIYHKFYKEIDNKFKMK